MTRTTFRPETDGFLFVNNWTFDNTEIGILRTLVTDALGAVEALLSPLIVALAGPVLIAEAGVPFIGPWLVAETVRKINEAAVNAIVNAIDANPYGLCGGMAFSSLDYWMKSWVVPQGTGNNDQPQRTSATGTTLRNYIWTRLLKSVQDNVVTFLQWMAVLGLEGGAGATWLRDQTSIHVSLLRSCILAGHPVTLGLVGTTSNPFNNHQVLCYGFNDNVDGTTSLFIYDNNHPGVESVITLDFSGSMLTTRHDDTFQADRGPLRGLFCTTYSPSEPPKAVVLRQGLSFTPAPFADVNQPVGVHYTAANIGYHTSTAIQLDAASDNGPPVGETGTTSIAEGSQRQLNGQLVYANPGNHPVAVRVSLGTFATIDITKVLPPESGNPASSGSVTVFNHRVIRAVRSSGQQCAVTGIAGGTTQFSVDTGDLGGGLAYHWSVSAGTLDNATTATPTVHWPATVGTAVTVSVVVTRPDGSFSSGSDSYTTISAEAAGLEQVLCQISHMQIFQHMFPFQYLPDPGPEQYAKVTPADLGALHDAAARLSEAAGVAMKANTSMLGRTTIAGHVEVARQLGEVETHAVLTLPLATDGKPLQP
jgi:hypothetical protein